MHSQLHSRIESYLNLLRMDGWIAFIVIVKEHYNKIVSSNSVESY